MGEIYWQLFERRSGASTSRSEASLVASSGLGGVIARAGVSMPVTIGCGNAWSVHGDALDGLVERVVPRESADAVDVAALGVIAFREGRAVAPDLASPIYVRNEVARTTAQRQADAAMRADTSVTVD